MAQEVRLQGRTYSDVPSVLLPDSNNVFHSFVDTSDADATARNIANGKTAYVNGVKLIGTSSGGGGMTDVVTTLLNGGLLHTITGAIDLSNDTVDARHLANGYTAHDAGGTAITGTMSGGEPWSWMGKNPTLVKTYTKSKVYLKNTDYATWTPSTTAGDIAATYDLESYTTDSTYDYVVLQKFHAHFEYGSGAQQKAMPTEYYSEYAYEIGYYSSNYASMVADTRNSKNGTYLTHFNGLFYYNSSGNMAYYNTSYGVYPGTISITHSTDAITPKFPKVSARCNATYFSTANAALVDTDNSYYECQLLIYRVDGGTGSYRRQYDIIRDMWENGM